MDMSNLTGLLDLTPQDQQGAINMGLLQAGLGILAHNTDRNNPMPAIGAGGLQGLQGYQAQRDFLQGQKLKQLQGLMLSANLQKALTQQKINDYLLKQIGGPAVDPTAALTQGAAVGDVGPTVTNAARAQPQTTNPFGKVPPMSALLDLSNNGGKELGKMVYDSTKPIMQVSNGYAYDANNVQPGFLPGIHTSQTGQTSMVTPDGKGGVSISAPQGALEAFTGYTSAQELAKAKMTPATVEYNGRPYSTTLDVKNAIESGVAPDAATAIKATQWGDRNGVPVKPIGVGTPTDQSPVAPAQAAAPTQAVPATVDPLTGNPLNLQPGQGLTSPEKILQDKAAETRATWNAQKPQAATAFMQKTQANDRLIQEANDILSSPGLGMATGITSLTSAIPGTAMYDTAAKLNALKSQISIAALAQMREASKTGGALGNVSNYEDQMLANSIAALNQAQTLPALKQSLQEVIKWSQQAKDRNATEYKTMYGSLPDLGYTAPSLANPIDLQSAAAAELARRGRK